MLSNQTYTTVTDNNSPTFTPYSNTITAASAGDFTIQFGTSIKSTTTNDTVAIAVFKNGSPVAGTERKTVFGSNIEWNTMETFAYLPSLVSGDVIDVRWATQGTSTATMHDHDMILQKLR
jgi:hypothetical protein